MLKKIIRIATRQSPLALWQAHHVGKALNNHWPHLEYTLVPMVTSGDKFLKDKLQSLGGKGLFVKELEEGLLAHTADIAVHSMKDMPATLPAGLAITAICVRDNPQDAFVSMQYKKLKDLPKQSLVGTTSLRRQSQLLALRPDLIVEPLRGNIQTRLSRLDAGDFDAIILAAAGLERMDYQARISELFTIDEMLPACAQGALGVECREDDLDVQKLIAPLNDTHTAVCIEAERQVNALLGGNCHVPVAIYCYERQNTLVLRARVLSLDGQKRLEAMQTGSYQDIVEKAKLCAEDLFAQGAGAILEH